VTDAIDRLRQATNHAERVEAFEGLLATLQSAGVFASHPVVAALSVRLLRPGSTARVDEALVGLLDRWEDAEQRLGIDLDLQAFAHLESSSDQFDRVSGFSAPPEDPVGWRMGQITGLLWPRGAAVRRQALRAPNPFDSLPLPDPLLLRASLGQGVTVLTVERLSDALSGDGPLAAYGEAEIQASSKESVAMRRALLEAAATPIEAGPLLHYPRVDGIRRGTQGFRARLVLDLVGE
jgi:hypothetical protein